jgi:formylglycine-generating enzyme required for sulfatase activity
MNQRQRAFRVGIAGILAGAALLACGCKRDVPETPPPAMAAAAPGASPAPASAPSSGPASVTGAASAMPARPGAGATMVNSVGMKFLHIPPGEFRMGSDPTEPGRHDDETAHDVKITRGFWIAATEVTQAQWQKVMGLNRAEPKGDNLPASRLSWPQAVEFCRKLSQAEGRTYRLPTEAQWEYACRSGSGGPYSGGKLDEVAWHMNNSGEAPHEVAGKKPNAWGLHDMHGNAAEWCRDLYQRDLGAAPAVDPAGPAEGAGGARVVRGGSWGHFGRACRGAARASFNPAYPLERVGLRVIIEPKSPNPSTNP